MPLGIVSDRDFELERNNSDVTIPKMSHDEKHEIPDAEVIPNDNSVITSDVIIQKTAGRLSDVPNVPQSLRKILGEEVETNGLKSAMQLVDSLVPPDRRISQPTLSTYARGEITPGTKDVDLSQYIEKRKGKISKKALNKLNLALAHLDDSKIAGCNAQELASVAKSMADVANKMEPKTKEETKDPIQFHIYAPSVRQENHYDTVVAKDNY